MDHMSKEEADIGMVAVVGKDCVPRKAKTWSDPKAASQAARTTSAHFQARRTLGATTCPKLVLT